MRVCMRSSKSKTDSWVLNEDKFEKTRVLQFWEKMWVVLAKLASTMAGLCYAVARVFRVVAMWLRKEPIWFGWFTVTSIMWFDEVYSPTFNLFIQIFRILNIPHYFRFHLWLDSAFPSMFFAIVQAIVTVINFLLYLYSFVLQVVSSSLRITNDAGTRWLNSSISERRNGGKQYFIMRKKSHSRFHEDSYHVFAQKID